MPPASENVAPTPQPYEVRRQPVDDISYAPEQTATAPYNQPVVTTQPAASPYGKLIVRTQSPYQPATTPPPYTTPGATTPNYAANPYATPHPQHCRLHQPIFTAQPRTAAKPSAYWARCRRSWCQPIPSPPSCDNRTSNSSVTKRRHFSGRYRPATWCRLRTAASRRNATNATRDIIIHACRAPRLPRPGRPDIVRPAAIARAATGLSQFDGPSNNITPLGPVPNSTGPTDSFTPMFTVLAVDMDVVISERKPVDSCSALP